MSTNQKMRAALCAWASDLEAGHQVWIPAASLRDIAAALAQAEQRQGRALAMRVLQSDLYAKLDDLERAECDALIAAPQPKESTS